jgi:hypothetical protein
MITPPFSLSGMNPGLHMPGKHSPTEPQSLPSLRISGSLTICWPQATFLSSNPHISIPLSGSFAWHLAPSVIFLLTFFFFTVCHPPPCCEFQGIICVLNASNRDWHTLSAQHLLEGWQSGLPSKHEAPSSNPSTAKKKKKIKPLLE